MKTHRQQVLERFGVPTDSHYSLRQLAKMSHVPLPILQQVYNRGVGAAKTATKSVRLKGSMVKNIDAPRSAKLSKEQWGFARVYSFLNGNPKHDNDLRSNKGAGVMDWVRAAVGIPKRPVIQRAIDVAQGLRGNYEPAVRTLLDQIGTRPIISAFVRRDPIQSFIDKAFNLITLGKWESVKRKYNYDKLFHLGLEVVVKLNESTGETARYVIEKNEVISISLAKPITKQTDIMIVPMTAGLTVNALLNGGKEVLGDKYFYYHPFENNCQDYILSLLKGSNLLTPALEQFIKQDVSQLVKELPSWTATLAKGITDVGGLWNVWLKGRGRGGREPSNAFSKQLATLGVSPAEYLQTAVRKAKAAGLANANLLGFSDDDTHKLVIPNESGRLVRFGRVGYNDHLLYTLSGNPKADQHRRQYRARATRIRGDWAKDPYSPNSLAVGILW